LRRLEGIELDQCTLLALDGESGRYGSTQIDTLAALKLKQDVRIAAQQQGATAQHPAVTRDGRRVTVVANIGGIADAQVALNLGEGSGTARTEFFSRPTTAPSGSRATGSVWRLRRYRYSSLIIAHWISEAQAASLLGLAAGS